jgi:uncharacterized protein (TIGR00369 family)
VSWEDGFRDSPYHRFLGLEFALAEGGVAEVRMPFREELVSDPDVPYLHGGVIGALLDIAGDYAVAAQLGRGVPTIDMRVDFLKTAGREPLVARARVIKLGRAVAIADAEAFNAQDERIAVGRILYSTR